VPIRHGRLSAAQEGVIDADVDAVPGRQVDEVLQACAVPRYVERFTCLESGGQLFLGRRDLLLQLLKHECLLLSRRRIS
jgi:hypothetical protein